MGCGRFNARRWQILGDAAITVLSKIGIEKVKQLYCKTGDKLKQISCQNLQNITNVAPKIYIKSMKNQGCVADVFLERFGAALGCQMLDFRSQNLENITKMAAQIDPKSMKNRSCVLGWFWERLWAPKGGCVVYPPLRFGSHF